MADSEQNLRNTIEKIAIENNFVDYEIEIKPISSGGANYTSTLNIATIKEGDNTHHLFAKVGTMGEKMREQAPKVYLNEIFIYTDLSKIYNSVQDHYNVPTEHRLTFATYYGSNPKEYEEIIVLEDLAAKGYQSFNRFKSVDWDYAVSAITELAKLHALSCAHSEYYPDDYKKVIIDLKFDWGLDSGPMSEYFDDVQKRAVNLVGANYKDKVKRFFDRFGKKKFLELFAPTRKSILVHGDYRPNNLMHKIRDDGTVDIKVLDLQTMQEGSPVVDLLYFIFVGSDEQFRAQYYEKLIDHYYTQLAASIKRLGLDPEKVYSRADFDYELKEKLPFGLTIAVFALPIVTVAEENAPKVDKNLDISALSIEKTSDLFSERLNGIVNDYDRWGVFDE